jgi:hypothetical protein
MFVITRTVFERIPPFQRSTHLRGAGADHGGPPRRPGKRLVVA